MLSRDQLIHLFDRFAFLTSQADVKRRIKQAVNDNQEAVAVTTTIQEEYLRKWESVGHNPRFGIACLGKVNAVYENDRDLMIQFYRFIAKEELACDEAELDPDEFSEKMLSHHRLHEQQLEMLKYMRRFHPDDQSVILETLRRQMEGSSFDGGAVLSPGHIEEIVRSRASPSPRDSR
ncbi:unnamed protein product [Spirodela intermedia]|uniref:Uncharacterized protein n=1 Tax=Spirodela intermedia TaxID=51605 RepID=A0A7I8JE12_SPIIN|nr:unnamed protein product [Spirodela intermedia]CAA6668357.1 unnamed protein product [Spirodela intermedia]